jgi:hypothetical protein
LYSKAPSGRKLMLDEPIHVSSFSKESRNPDEGFDVEAVTEKDELLIWVGKEVAYVKREGIVVA